MLVVYLPALLSIKFFTFCDICGHNKLILHGLSIWHRVLTDWRLGTPDPECVSPIDNACVEGSGYVRLTTKLQTKHFVLLHGAYIEYGT